MAALARVWSGTAGRAGLLLLAAVVLSGCGVNQIPTFDERAKAAWSQVLNQYQRRADLIPNLVETAKGYLTHERETLEAVIAARGAAMAGLRAAAADPANAKAVKTLAGAESALSGALGRLLAVAEAYPDLKANQNMMQLTEELTSTENRVSFARQSYNDSVMTYNTSCETFPSSLIAGMFGFTNAELFELTVTAEREAPKVSFS